MANTSIVYPGVVTDWTVGTVLYNEAGQVYNGSAFVTFVLGNWATYNRSTPETPSGSRRYVCAMPSGLPAGHYFWRHYMRVGGTFASSDPDIGGGDDYWDGTTFGSVAVASLPTVPPAGYASLSGTGSVIVTQDYGGLGNFSATDALGNGIGGATVTAFLASDYTTNGRNATPKAQVVTTASGQWQTAMLLNPATAYTIVFSDRGFLANPASLTTA